MLPTQPRTCPASSGRWPRSRGCEDDVRDTACRAKMTLPDPAQAGDGMTESVTLEVDLEPLVAERLRMLASQAQLSPSLLAAELIARMVEQETEEVALIERRVQEADAGGAFI